MITHIRMKNFKSWKDSGKIELAPLTGFFGTNSSGKSSLLQTLLLLKQTMRTDETLFFGDENSLVNLGSFSEVIHNRDQEESLQLEFGCKSSELFTVKVYGRKRDGFHEGYFPISIDNFTFNTVINQNDGKLQIVNLGYRFKSPHLPKVNREISPKVYKNLSEIIHVNWGDSWIIHIDSLNQQHRFTQKVKNCYGVPSSGDESLGQLSSALENLFDSIFFLGPTRAYPQHSYHWEGTHPENIGQLGDKAIDALLSSRVEQLTTSHEGADIPIEKRISAWLQDMELAYSFSLRRSSSSVRSTPQDDKNYEVRVQKSRDSAEVMIAAMGYGLSQFLPVLVYCYYAPEGSTLILEQPGMHLHPKVQSQLADLLIEVVTERNLQVLVESHSEHLLNRLQRRVAEEKIGADQTALYFCQNDKGVSTIDHLKMDEFGNIENWPPNFFGDEMGDLFAMTEAQMERQKRMED